MTKIFICVAGLVELISGKSRTTIGLLKCYIYDEKRIGSASKLDIKSFLYTNQDTLEPTSQSLNHERMDDHS